MRTKNIANGEDERFTMENDYVITFTPKAPSVFIQNLKNENGKVTVMLANNDKENSNGYVMILGIYSKDNQMKDSRVFSGDLEKNSEIKLEYEFEMDGEDRIGCFLLDSFLTMNYLNCPVIK